MSSTSTSAERRLLIWGASGHALVVADIVRLLGECQIVGFLDNVNPERARTAFCGATILGGEECLESLSKSGVREMILAFGNCEARLNYSEVARDYGFSLYTAVHPQAVVASDVEMGAGTVVMAGAVINPACEIGKNVIINTCASVDHECVIEDGVHICPGTHLAGRVTVERGAWVGVGATVSDRVHIGAGSLIGAGSVVIRDVPPGVVVYGVPARLIRNNEDH